MAEIRQVAELEPELDFLSLKRVVGEEGNVRDRVNRLKNSGTVIGIVPGIYVTAPELRKRPVSLEVLANMIYGPSYVSFEYALSKSALIPEAVSGVASATRKRNRDFDTPLGRFSYRSIPAEAYYFGWTREALSDGADYASRMPGATSRVFFMRLLGKFWSRPVNVAYNRGMEANIDRTDIEAVAFEIAA
jgi:hypothetical protein